MFSSYADSMMILGNSLSDFVQGENYLLRRPHELAFPQPEWTDRQGRLPDVKTKKEFEILQNRKSREMNLAIQHPRYCVLPVPFVQLEQVNQLIKKSV